MLCKVTKVCTLLWFKKKKSISAAKNVSSHCTSRRKQRKVCGCNVAHLVPVKNFGL